MVIFILTIGTAFLGYVLPWGQISYWGATVITNLLSAIPYFGIVLVEWVWGGFSIGNATLNRFFALHYLFPFLIVVLVLLHLIFLHTTGSSNPLGLNSRSNKVRFHWAYIIKDGFGFFVVIFIAIGLVMFFPNLMGDPENWVVANPLVTPIHIKPEWYFLWAYAILRSIPNKLGGVIIMFAAILFFFLAPIQQHKFQSRSFYPVRQIIFWMFVSISVILT